MHASGSRSRIIDMCTIHTCIQGQGSSINASYVYVRFSHMYHDQRSYRYASWIYASHASGIHASRIYAWWIHVSRIHASQIHASRNHASRIDASQIHASRLHASWIHTSWIHASWIHASWIHASSTIRITDICIMDTIMDTAAWVTRPERPKGAKDDVKQARRAQSRPGGPLDF